MKKLQGGKKQKVDTARVNEGRKDQREKDNNGAFILHNALFTPSHSKTEEKYLTFWIAINK